MIKNPFYSNLILDGEAYLAPYGSAGAKGEAPVAVNNALASLWENAGETMTGTGNCDGREMPVIENLPERLIVGQEEIMEDSLFFTASVAGCNMAFYDEVGGLSQTLKDFFEDFISGGDEAAVEKRCCISICWDKGYDKEKMTVLLADEEMSVYESIGKYIIAFHDFQCVKRVTIDKSLEKAHIYMKRTSDLLDLELQMAVRNIFALVQMNMGRVFLHSSSVLYRDRVWAFSAGAGTGKSTHTNFWIESGFGKAVNGDLNLIGIENDRVKVYASPWCGTSGLYCREDYFLGGIVLLQRGAGNEVRKADRHRAISVLARITSPMWTEDQLKRNADLVSAVCRKTEVLILTCTKDFASFETMKAYIDNLK